MFPESLSVTATGPWDYVDFEGLLIEETQDENKNGSNPQDLFRLGRQSFPAVAATSGLE